MALRDLPIGLPTSSLNGLVISEMFTARLTTKPAKTLNVGLAYTYNDRDNKTPVNTYAFYDAEEPKTGASAFNGVLGLAPDTLGSNINIYANRPYSKKVNTVVADTDYLFAPGQSVKGAYEYQQIDRNCPGSWINCPTRPRRARIRCASPTTATSARRSAPGRAMRIRIVRSITIRTPGRR
jgi:Putative outer membrane beta-barrel porin, MtrB/PioB